MQSLCIPHIHVGQSPALWAILLLQGTATIHRYDLAGYIAGITHQKKQSLGDILRLAAGFKGGSG